MFKTVNIRNVKTQDKKDKMAFHTPWNKFQMVFANDSAWRRLCAHFTEKASMRSEKKILGKGDFRITCSWKGQLEKREVE